MKKLEITDPNSPEIDTAIKELDQQQARVQEDKHDEEEKKIIDVNGIRNMFDTISKIFFKLNFS